MKIQSKITLSLSAVVLVMTAALAPPRVLAYGNTHQAKSQPSAIDPEVHAFGQQGNSAQVTRTITTA